MAITKILHMKQAKSGYMAKHLANGLKYIMDPDKTEDGRYIGGSNCFPENALEQMLETKRHFGKLDKRQGYHFIISFEEEEITENTAFELVGEFVKEYLGKDYEAVYAIHNDTDHIHGHIIFNSVRCTDGYKYDYPKGEWEHRIQPLVNDLCKKYGLSVLDLEEIKEKRKRRQKGETEKPRQKKKMSARNQRIRRDVDRAVEDAETYEEFLENLRSMGYELSGRKHLAVRETGAERVRRLDLLGEEYTEEMLRYRIEHSSYPASEADQNRDKLFYIYIPYRNRHLTRYQKECFIRKYRAGKIRKRPDGWKYKRSLQELRRLQEEYLFWAKHNIRSKQDLYTAMAEAKAMSEKIQEQHRKLTGEKKDYQDVLQLYKELGKYQMEAELYKEGYQEFSEEAGVYEKLCEKFAEAGYTVEEAGKLETDFQSGEQKLKEKRREAIKDKRTGERLLHKVYEKEKKREKAIEKKRS
ncbi:MAG TPA: relaxase/mobilization nuclease domain-containing protein [Candidatus Blautia stercorigallinarum]|uniref:Relaxase/mobilization nuclease domain-containing protein n=1 Tax=Candidatus Blautia stercorigallinarum TaxID=2838501 RepID=A0A9D1TFL1_9FIRM|nr:relaxase/mobilization nuclease domain-containing protein [Candidatus Blautia stercorigallinarum]